MTAPAAPRLDELAHPTDASAAMPTGNGGASGRSVVGADGSCESVHVLRWTARIANTNGAPIERRTTWQAWVGVVTAPPLGPYRRAGSDAHALLVRAADFGYGDDQPPQLTLQVREGSAAHILTEESKTAQLPVVGSHGLEEIAGLLLGSVSTHCAEHAEGSVLIVREPDQP